MSAKKRGVILIAATAAALCLALILIFAPRGQKAPIDGKNLLKNGDFAELRADGRPSDWQADSYVFTSGYTSYTMETQGDVNVAVIKNRALNDARYAQSVAVEPNELYCLRGFVKASASDGLGANLSIEGVYAFSESVYDSAGEWREVRLYGRTGETQSSVTVFARLGGYSGESVGEARFKNLSLTRVADVPDEYSIYNWFAVDRSALEAPAQEEYEASAWPYLVAVAIVYLLACALLMRASLTGQTPESPLAVRRGYLIVLPALLLAAAARLITARLIPGYSGDVACFTGWANVMANTGARGFYEASGFCDYPPGYILVLGVLGWLGKLRGSGATEMIIKLPSIASDLMAALLLYRFAAKRAPVRAAVTISLLYAFNPLTFAAGAAWGQSDGVMALGILVTVLLAIENKWFLALPVYMLTVLMKPQALMFGPVGLIALISQFIRKYDKRLLRDTLIGIGGAVAVALAVILPFSPDMENPLWIIELYKGTMGYYDSASLNACNLYFLLGDNWVKTAQATDLLTRALAMALLFGGLLAAALRFGWLKIKRGMGAQALLRFGLIVLTAAFAAAVALLPLRYAALGTCCIALSVFLCAGLYLLGGEIRHLPLIGGVLLLSLCVTGTMMHERYLFAASLLLLAACAAERDARVYALFALVTACVFLNVGCVLDRAIRIGGTAGHLDAPAFSIQSDSAGLEYAVSLVSCLACAFGVYVSAAVVGAGHTLSLPARGARGAFNAPGASFDRAEESLLRPMPIRRMQRADWLIMLGVTALYAVPALLNLGAVSSPQTFWRAMRQSESVVVDTGAQRDMNLLYLPGIHDRHDSDFTVQVSADGVNWSEEYWCEVKEGNCFQWKYACDTYASGGSVSYTTAPRVLTGRYVRFNAKTIGHTLYEVILRDPDTKEKYPLTLVSGDGANLIDEQDAFTGEPGWFNSMYFDEIYHARTAYEHYLAMRGDLSYATYETSHPPLGKVLMAFSISIFGMTPFGWRFAGALAGILMLPGVYFMGKLLTKRRSTAFAAMFLMAVDCMHFTQTRIATIDSFVVLFIIWATACMIYYARMDYWRVKLYKTLIPLALSGLFMGLACASKWTGCYAGVGLAAIFFWSLWRRLRESAYAARRLRESRGRREREAADPALAIAAKEGASRALITLLSCLAFFIAVPLLIYYASYIPYFLYSGGVTVKKVIQAAVGDYFDTGVVGGMLGYHGTPGLGMDHPFYSPWYQWPVIGKPMWYNADAYEPAGYAGTIFALGNPAVWWGGLLGLLGVIAVWGARHVTKRGFRLHPAQNDMRPALLLIAFAAQYLPWVLVPRGTYIYHYFTSVPFIILCAVLCFDLLLDKAEAPLALPSWRRAAVSWNDWFGRRVSDEARARAQAPVTFNVQKWPLYALYAYLLLALVLFIAFFPYASGALTKVEWLQAMQWFNNWLYY